MPRRASPVVLVIAPPGQTESKAIVLILRRRAGAAPAWNPSADATAGLRRGRSGRPSPTRTSTRNGANCTRPPTRTSSRSRKSSIAGVDVAVEAEIAEQDISLLRSNRRVDLVAADREIVLVEPIAVGERDEIADAHRRSARQCRTASVRPMPSGKHDRLARQAIALADIGGHRDAGQVQRIIDAISEPRRSSHRS